VSVDKNRIRIEAERQRQAQARQAKKWGAPALKVAGLEHRAVVKPARVAKPEREHKPLAKPEDVQERVLWCILRTNSNRTLVLAQSLADAGFKVWTPKTVSSRRKGRTRQRFEFDIAVMPSFVFAHSDHLLDLYAIASLPGSPHPKFTIFQHAGRVPAVAYRDLEVMRDAELDEERARLAKAEADLAAFLRKGRKTQGSHFRAGDLVRIEDGPCAGMEGVVVRNKQGRAVVNFGGKRELNIGSWLLLPNALSGTSAPEVLASRAA